MAITQWDADLSIGIEVIDRQRQALLDDLLLADGLIAGGCSRSRIEQVLRQLSRHARHHFRCEELLMRLSGYDALHSHAAEHRALEAEVDEVADHASEAARSIGARWQILAKRFCQHLCVDDLRMRPALDRLGVSVAA